MPEPVFNLLDLIKVMESTTYSGTEFLKALQEGVLKSEYSVCGMAKASENADELLFAPGTSCGYWIPIPLTVVERIEFVKMVPCKDHEHAFVCLYLQAPNEGIGGVLLQLLKALQAQVSKPTQPSAYLAGAGSPPTQPQTFRPAAQFAAQPQIGMSPASPPSRYEANSVHLFNVCGPYRRLCTSGDSWWCCDLDWNICCDDSNLGCKWCT